MRIRDLRGLVSKWQKKLNLPEWSIESQFVRWNEINNDPGKENFIAGDLNWFLPKLVASMRVVPKCDRPQNMLGTVEMYNEEYTVVHELVHLILASTTWQNANDLECAVNRITIALLGGRK